MALLRWVRPATLWLCKATPLETRRRQMPTGNQSTHAQMISIQPKKLLLSKWTAIAPLSKEKHFLVTKVVPPELECGRVEWIDLQAVHSKATRRMLWKELRDSAQWVRGWV